MVLLKTTAPHTAVEAISYRAGTPDDRHALHRVLQHALADLKYRLGLRPTNASPDSGELAAGWDQLADIYEHLATTAEHCWVAEQDDEIVGFARTIQQDGLRELTELFVLPDCQSAAVGKELLRRAFPAAGATHRCIIATTDVRAQALYLKAGMYPRFPIYTFSRKPEAVSVHPSAGWEVLAQTDDVVHLLGTIDEAVLGFRRDADHRWLLANRNGFLYTLHGQVIGYGYVGTFSGPFAAYDPQHFPMILAHAETHSTRQGYTEFALNVSTVNQVAVQYLLTHGYQLGPFFCHMMSDNVFGHFDRYIGISPMLLV